MRLRLLAVQLDILTSDLNNCQDKHQRKQLLKEMKFAIDQLDELILRERSILESEQHLVPHRASA
jgi:hypothetical protein